MKNWRTLNHLQVTLYGRVRDFYRPLQAGRKTAGITVFDNSMLMSPAAIEMRHEIVSHELGYLPNGLVVAHVAIDKGG